MPLYMSALVFANQTARRAIKVGGTTVKDLLSRAAHELEWESSIESSTP